MSVCPVCRFVPWLDGQFCCVVISYLDAQDYADLQDAIFIETSAKTAVNVSALFLEISMRKFFSCTLCTLF